MNALEIMNRPNGAQVTIEEKVCVVQWYIQQRKGVRVNIELEVYEVQDFFGGFGSPVGQELHPSEQHLLNKAFEIACNWYAVTRHQC